MTPTVAYLFGIASVLAVQLAWRYRIRLKAAGARLVDKLKAARKP